jgi:hypothetical protein
MERFSFHFMAETTSAFGGKRSCHRVGGFTSFPSFTPIRNLAKSGFSILRNSPMIPIATDCARSGEIWVTPWIVLACGI